MMSRNLGRLFVSSISIFRQNRLTILCSVLVLPWLVSCGGDSGGGQGDSREHGFLHMDARSPIGFGYLSGISVLSNGRILAADPFSQILVSLDLDAGTADTLGREGAGPQEYNGPDQVFPLPGDSTLLVDLGNSRLIVVDPEGEFVEWIPMSRQAAGGEAMSIKPEFVDAEGFFYASRSGGAPDSLTIHRIDRATWEETQLGSAWRTPYERRPRGSKRRMLTLYDSWAVAPDGRIAVVHSNGYSVDWIFADGSTAHGPANDVETYPIGPAEMDAYLEFFSNNVTMSFAMVGEDGSTQSTSMSRGLPPEMRQGVDEYEWPDFLPAFKLEYTRISPSGELWVHRFVPAGSPERVEVFDDSGARVGFVELPTGCYVLGFGDSDSEVYIAHPDDMGLIWLERHSLVTAEDRG